MTTVGARRAHSGPEMLLRLLARLARVRASVAYAVIVTCVTVARTQDMFEAQRTCLRRRSAPQVGVCAVAPESNAREARSGHRL
jgi:hypothetical protein